MYVLLDQLHKNRVWEDYHAKEGVQKRIQSPDGPMGKQSVLEQAIAAPSLLEACEIAGIEVKSVTDMDKLRKDTKREPDFVHRYPNAIWKVLDWTKDCGRALYIHGNTDLGKTQWACGQFFNPKVVSDINELRTFDPLRHDGIVFDDMEFSKLSRNQIIHLLDWEMDRAIRVLYGTAHIPAGTPKIFTGNKPFRMAFFGNDPDECAGDKPEVRRRVKIIELPNERLWEDPPAAPDVMGMEGLGLGAAGEGAAEWDEAAAAADGFAADYDFDLDWLGLGLRFSQSDEPAPAAHPPAAVFAASEEVWPEDEAEEVVGAKRKVCAISDGDSDD